MSNNVCQERWTRRLLFDLVAATRWSLVDVSMSFVDRSVDQGKPPTSALERSAQSRWLNCCS